MVTVIVGLFKRKILKGDFMDVVPNTKLYLLKGVPITNNYKDTLYFASTTAQYNYFYSKRIQTYTDFTYQRVESGKLRVALGAEDCYACNYLMFQNSGFGTKWFYAFITGVEYINNACTEITYELDKIQTWFYDLTLKPCYIKRQHDPDDTIYANCEAENFNVDAKYVNTHQNIYIGNTFVVISTGHYDTTNNVWVDYQGSSLVNRIPTTVEINYFADDFTGRPALTEFIQNAVMHGHEESIIAVYCASRFVGDSPTFDVVTNSTYGDTKANLRANAFQGYVPKNNKLYNYPFCKLTIASPGGEQDYAYEDFRSGQTSTDIANADFQLYAVAVPSPSLMIAPKSYRGEAINYDESMVITDFPIIPFKGDSYEMWCVQNSGGHIADFIGHVAAALVSGGSSDAIGGAIGVRGAILSVADSVGQWLNARNTPDKAYGVQKGSIYSNLGINGFRLESKTIDYWQARQIDGYFTMFGYAQNNVMTPNIHARSKWTYIETEGCTLTGNAPSDDISFIENCFNKGITFWVNPSEVGDYSLTNAVLT